MTQQVLFFSCFLLSIIVFSANASIGSFCHKAFSRKKHESFTRDMYKDDALSNILVSAYLTAKDLKWITNAKQIKVSEQGLKEMLEWLKHPQKQHQADDLIPTLKHTINKIPEMMQWTTKLSNEELNYFKPIVQATLSLFIKHIPSALKEDPAQVDWNRIQLIAKNISEFNEQTPRFSFYKIKRAIEGRYSLKEFILCLM